MSQPFVSVVVETVTSRYDSAGGQLVEDLAKTLGAIERQTWPADRRETILVLDDNFDAAVAAEIRRRHPDVRIASAAVTNYFAAKNAGAKIATGELIALVDGDCVPEADWLELLVGALTPEYGVVAGRTRYDGPSLLARTFTVPDFAHVMTEGERGVSGFNINNLVYRRDVYLSHLLDERIERNGGCYFQFHQLRADGIRVGYEPRAVVWHGLDIHGLGFVSKHFDRGRETINIYRLDDRHVVRSTPLVRRAGPFALFPLYARRVVLDWLRIARNRGQIGVPAVALPYYFGVVTMTRMIELAGALTAFLPRRITRQERPA